MPDYGHPLQFGIFLTPSNEQPQAVVALAELAEQVGLDLVSFQDHPYQARFLDTWTLLSYLAARTTRIKLAPNVLNLPLRPPAVLARAAASLDLLSGGRVELGLGAGAFWDGIEAMGGHKLGAGESVEALAEAIEVLRALWDTEQRGGARFEGTHYRLAGAKRGPAPAHPIELWIGAYKPKMLALTGRLGDGWLPSVPYMERGQLASGNAAIDAAAREAGRDPAAVRRLLNVSGSYVGGEPGPTEGSTDQWVEELAQLAVEHGFSTFVAMADDPRTIELFATEVAPAVRELVAAERAGTVAPRGEAAPEPLATNEAVSEAPPPAASEYERLGVVPTPDDGTRLSAELPWDEASRPHRPPSAPEVEYSDRGRQVGQHLVDVHDMLRKELTELREVVAQVREGAVTPGDARSALNEMAMRQNDWTLGAFCSRYCRAVAQHHGLEDEAVFPHLRRSDAGLEPVIDRLHEEHLVIHDAIEAVDRALVGHINDPTDFEPLQSALDLLTDTLLSHLSYEEFELVEPLARLGFHPGQL
jgi:alkanesulfonate monooxygenase SsuD/methylene tetrahydromethanopterin reductase-like flavin-dependent oxidoreductase (luciferase family)